MGMLPEAWSNEKKRTYKIYAFFLLSLLIYKSILVLKLPIVVIGESYLDDRLLANMAETLRAGKWLGEYSQYTLVKGAFSSMLLAFCDWLGAPFVWMNNNLYSLACILFVISIRPLFKSKWRDALLMALFVILLFSPITYSYTAQRIYRNQLLQWQVVAIFACLLALYVRKEEKPKKLLGWALTGGFVLWSFCYTREDAMWIYPFVVVALIVNAFSILRKGRRRFSWQTFGRLSVMVLPVVLLVLGNVAISMLNKHYYGLYTINDRTGSNFAKVASDLYSIAPNEEVERLHEGKYIAVYNESIDRAYAASPTLASIRPALDAYFAAWDGGDPTKRDEELLNDYVFYALRDGAAGSGYYVNAFAANEFYGKVHGELQEAFQNGTLEKRNSFSFALVAPWKDSYWGMLPTAFAQAVNAVTNYTDVWTVTYVATGNSETNIVDMEALAGGSAVRDNAVYKEIQITGWLAPNMESEQLNLAVIKKDGTIIHQFEHENSMDVAEYFRSLGNDDPNLGKCRFSYILKGYSIDDDLLFQITDDSASVIDRIPLGQIYDNGLSRSADRYTLYLDTLAESGPEDPLFAHTAHLVQRCNSITSIYRGTGKYMSFLGFFCYIALSVITFRKKRKDKESRLFDVWLILTALALSFVVLVAGLAYNHISAYPTITPFYMSCAYPLVLMFWTFSIAKVLDILLARNW